MSEMYKTQKYHKGIQAENELLTVLQTSHVNKKKAWESKWQSSFKIVKFTSDCSAMTENVHYSMKYNTNVANVQHMQPRDVVLGNN